MTDDMKLTIEKFNGTNFAYWKMQIEDLLYQKNFYLPLGGKAKKPTTMSDAEWEVLDRKALGTVRLSLSKSVTFNISKEKTTKDVMDALSRMYEKPSASNKVFLMRKLFNMKMVEGGVVAEHLNEFNTVMSQLSSVNVQFEDEIWALLVLSSLPDSWNGMVTSLSNSSGSTKLKFDDVVSAILDEEIRRKPSGESSGSALNVGNRGRSSEREQSHGRSKSRSKSRSSKGKIECWNCGKKGHLKKDCRAPPKKNKQKNGNKDNEASANVAGDAVQDALILAFDYKSESWVIDSGASFHATAHKEYLKNYVQGDFGKVYLGDDEPCDIIGKGDVQIKLPNGSIWQLNDVRHVPSLKRNLISVGQLASSGHVTVFADDFWKVTKGSMVVARGKKEGTLYLTNSSTSSIAVADKGIDSNTWHYRLGHMSEKGMKILHSKGKLEGLKSLDLEFCEDCVFGKQKKVTFSKVGRPPKSERLELVHTDVWGQTQVPSLGGSSYFVTFIDDATRKLWVYPMKHKSDVFDVFKKWKALVENETGLKLKCLRSDNGGEYCSKEFEEYCAKNGIKREKTIPNTPQQNGVAERMNRTIVERARSMRLHAGLPKQFWAEAVNAAAYLINRGPSVPLDGGLPEEAWTGKEVNLSHLKVFGCISYVHVDAEKRDKLDSKSRKCTFIGYGSDEFGYRFWDEENRKIIRSRNVIFNEKVMHKNKDKVHEDSNEYLELDDTSENDVPEVHGNENPQVDPQTPAPVRRSSRTPKPTQRYSPSLFYLLLTDGGEPECYEEALQVETRARWEQAMEDEMKSLSSNQTWDLVQLPKGKKALHNKWVYKLKEEHNGSKRYKARLVAKGFQQKAGIDYSELFSPVVKLNTIRSVLSIVAVENLHLEQLDVKTAFLHGDLEEDIYMHQPQGYAVPGKEEMVCKLKKSLYGLKQAPRQWYIKFDSFMYNTGYKRCHADHCCYFKSFDDCYIILLLYVDDMLVAGSNMHAINNLKKQLSQEFEMKDLGAANQILGMRISRDMKNRTLKLSQAEYVEKVLNKFNMHGAKPVSTPLASHFKLSKELSPKTEQEKENMSKVPYASAVGSLMYAMVCTRPDIAHAVGVVSRFMSNPGKMHWEAVKWILRYLRGTTKAALHFGGSEIKLHGYVDSDLAGDLDRSRSTTGYVFTLGSAAVSWKSQLQDVVALSTTEAEYVAATEASKEMIWLQELMEELGKKQESSRLYSDSKSAIHLAKNSAFHPKTKHIRIRYHFIRWLLEEKVLKLEKILSSENPADMFTKVVTTEKLKLCSASVGLQA